ncbi:IclR family transcriptional regulator [Nocardioides sp. YIM 152315]|uniref:IclR family transcriptional regulator n=1 Tax=Nocardioides sp. YIM 152315 TaxID=3031760 RepID=UPI0023DC7228|nr:IclR family transcriptional regulator [Nocardioides sp. YIM 152315]MDF1604660.1 IclR family transcriptional regulator [Nocardioides sp. YIM 152315]
MVATEPERVVEPRPSPSMIERMTSIIDAFDGIHDRLSLEAVCTRTGLARSTAHRILDHLIKLAWVERDELGYRLGSRTRSLATCDHDHLDLRGVSAPVLHELAMRTGMVVHLGVHEGADVAYLDKVGGRFAFAVPSRVGGRIPAHTTALGKALLAWLPAEEVDIRLAGALRRNTHRTIADGAVLHQELHRIRQRNGIAFERGECFEQIACVASAVRTSEGPLAAVSVVGDRQAPLEQLAPLVRAAVDRVAADIATARRACRADDPVDGWSPEVLDQLLANHTGAWF